MGGWLLLAWRPLRAQLVQQLLHQPLRMAVQGAVVGRRILLGDGGQLVQTALQAPQDGVHHPGGPWIFAVGPGKGHRAVHRRAVGDPGEEQHLIGPQPQGLDHLALHPLQGDIGKFSKIKIQKQLVLKHPEAQLGRQRRVPAIQPGRRQLLFQRAVRPPSLPLAGVQGQQRRLPCVHPVLLLLQLTLLFPAGAASAPSGSQFLTPNSPTGVPGGNRRQTSAGSQAPEAL